MEVYPLKMMWYTAYWSTGRSHMLYHDYDCMPSTYPMIRYIPTKSADCKRRTGAWDSSAGILDACLCPMARAPWRLWVCGSDHPNMQDISGWPPKKDKIKNQESDVYKGHTRKAENVMMDGRFKGLFKDLAETVSMVSARAFCGVATSCGDFIHCTCWKTLVRNRPTDFQLITFSTDNILTQPTFASFAEDQHSHESCKCP